MVQAEVLKEGVLAALADRKARDVVAMDVRPLTTITDFMVVAGGTSDRHVRSLAEAVTEAARKLGIRPLGIEGLPAAEWVLVDLGDVVVHVMQPEARAFYQLEKLWHPAVAEPASGARP